jgi:hypothetical protein
MSGLMILRFYHTPETRIHAFQIAAYRLGVLDASARGSHPGRRDGGKKG